MARPRLLPRDRPPGRRSLHRPSAGSAEGARPAPVEAPGRGPRRGPRVSAARRIAATALLLTLAACGGGGGGGGGPTTPPPPPTPAITFTATGTSSPNSIVLASGASTTATTLFLEVRALSVEDVYGVAFDLRYPSNLLQFVRATPGSLFETGSAQAAPSGEGNLVVGAT